MNRNVCTPTLSAATSRAQEGKQSLAWQVLMVWSETGRMEQAWPHGTWPGSGGLGVGTKRSWSPGMPPLSGLDWLSSFRLTWAFCPARQFP